MRKPNGLCMVCNRKIPWRPFALVSRYYCGDACFLKAEAARNKAERERREALGVKV